jgi:hypothetical protein
MGKLFCAGLTASALLWFGLPAARADESKNVKRILDKAIAAMGGEAKLARAKAAHWRARGTLHRAPGGPVSFTGEWWLQLPGQMKIALQLDKGGASRVTLLDGDRGWITGPEGTQEMSLDQVTLAKEGLYLEELTFIVPLRGPAFKLEEAGGTKVDEQPAAAIKVTSPGHGDVTLFFDRQTGLLAKSSRSTRDPLGPTETLVDTFYTDYKDFGGIPRARKISVHQDGKPFVDLVVTDFTASERVENGPFAHPRD